ncbi:hypothetical protein D3C72_1873310 [compost metagenome]
MDGLPAFHIGRGFWPGQEECPAGTIAQAQPPPAHEVIADVDFAAALLIQPPHPVVAPIHELTRWELYDLLGFVVELQVGIAQGCWLANAHAVFKQPAAAVTVDGIVVTVDIVLFRQFRGFPGQTTHQWNSGPGRIPFVFGQIACRILGRSECRERLGVLVFRHARLAE